MKLRDMARLDAGKWLRAKTGDTGYDVAGLVVRMIITLVCVCFALLMIIEHLEF